MKELINENWSHTLSEAGNGELLLAVVCGTVAIFEITIVLNSDERARYKKEGASFVSELAGHVRDRPSDYLSRRM